jgi:hypothetical protein
MGLGDFLLTNGLVRNLVKPEGQFVLFVNKKYKESISFMYRDLKNLSFVYVPPVAYNGFTIRAYIRDIDYKLLVVGYENFTGVLPFDQSCYRQFNVDFQKRWTDFHVERDLEREKKLFDHFGVKEGEYVFIHDGGSENSRFINESSLSTTLRKIKVDPTLTENIFDYCYLIEHAAEVHVIESSFVFLCEVIPTTGKMFIYRSPEGKDPKNASVMPTYKKNWTII